MIAIILLGLFGCSEEDEPRKYQCQAIDQNTQNRTASQTIILEILSDDPNIILYVDVKDTDRILQVNEFEINQAGNRTFVKTLNFFDEGDVMRYGVIRCDGKIPSGTYSIRITDSNSEYEGSGPIDQAHQVTLTEWMVL